MKPTRPFGTKKIGNKTRVYITIKIKNKSGRKYPSVWGVEYQRNTVQFQINGGGGI